jgi:hypothetical protein
MCLGDVLLRSNILIDVSHGYEWNKTIFYSILLPKP